MHKPTSIDEYIEAQRLDAQPRLKLIRKTFAAALPLATEKITWNMPTFWQVHNIIHFAAWKHHIGIYPGDQAIIHFSQRLQEFPTSKGSFSIPDEAELPLPLLSDIAHWCLETYNHQ